MDLENLTYVVILEPDQWDRDHDIANGGVYGPFPSSEAANEWARESIGNRALWSVSLIQPTEDFRPNWNLYPQRLDLCGCGANWFDERTGHGSVSVPHACAPTGRAAPTNKEQ